MISPDAMQTFLQNHWRTSCFRTEITGTTLETLRHELYDFEPHELISHHKGLASVWFEDEAKQHQAVDLAPDEALKFYRAGMTVFLPEVASKTLSEWQLEMAHKVGFHSKSKICGAFLSRRGSSTGCHFDHIENFTIQLRGSKRWRVCENKHVQLPTVNYSVRSSRAYQEEMWLYAKSPLPAAIPDHATSFEVSPGAVVYVPRGFWHEVQSVEESVSVFLGFPAQTWIDLVLPGLRTLLLRDPAWRENALYPEGDTQQWLASRAHLKTLCQRLGDALREMEPDAFLPPPPLVRDEPPDAIYRTNALCSVGVYRGEDSSVRLVASVHQGDFGRTREALIPIDWLPGVDYAKAARTFTQGDFCRANRALAHVASALMQALLQLDVVRLYDPAENASL